MRKLKGIEIDNFEEDISNN